MHMGFPDVNYEPPEPMTVYAVGEGEKEPEITAEKDMFEYIFDAFEAALYDAECNNEPFSLWRICPDKHMIAMVYPEKTNEDNS